MLHSFGPFTRFAIVAVLTLVVFLPLSLVYRAKTRSLRSASPELDQDLFDLGSANFDSDAHRWAFAKRAWRWFLGLADAADHEDPRVRQAIRQLRTSQLTGERPVATFLLLVADTSEDAAELQETRSELMEAIGDGIERKRPTGRPREAVSLSGRRVDLSEVTIVVVRCSGSVRLARWCWRRPPFAAECSLGELMNFLDDVTPVPNRANPIQDAGEARPAADQNYIATDYLGRTPPTDPLPTDAGPAHTVEAIIELIENGRSCGQCRLGRGHRSRATIGRALDSDLVVTSSATALSRNHLVVEAVGDQVMTTDRSLAGTWLVDPDGVTREKLPEGQPTRVPVGWHLRLGDWTGVEVHIAWQR